MHDEWLVGRRQVTALRRGTTSVTFMHKLSIANQTAFRIDSAFNALAARESPEQSSQQTGHQVPHHSPVSRTTLTYVPDKVVVPAAARF